MDYLLLLKTGTSELRAWRKLSTERKKKISVHCEITRGRKKPQKDQTIEAEYNIKRVYHDVITEFSDCSSIVIDITREESLSSKTTRQLSSADNGYQKWVETVFELHKGNSLVRPTLIVNPSPDDTADDYERDLISQFDAFAVFDHISYRASVLHDQEFIADFEILQDRINNFIERGAKFQLLLDFEYLAPSTSNVHAIYAAEVIRNVRALTPNITIVSVGTSFPRDVTQIGGERTDEFRLEEVSLNAELNRLQNTPIGYGDYGSINPERNDLQGGPGVYQRARVDFPTAYNTILYYRVDPVVDDNKQLVSPRSIMYREACRQIAADQRFSSIGDSWGYKKILEARTGLPEGANASFWISARMEMHICRQVDRLFSQST